jgi:hypothetical protein
LIAELAEGATVSQRLLESTASARAAEHTILPVDSVDAGGGSAPPELPPTATDDGQQGRWRDS